MSLAVLHKCERFSLMLAILFLPITSSPAKISDLFGGNISNWFMYAGFLFLGYEFWKYGITIPARFKKYIVIFSVWQIVCLAVGLYMYPFTSLLVLGQSPKLTLLLSQLSSHGLVFNEISALKMWLFVRFTSYILVKSNLMFYALFFVFYLYKDNYAQGFKDIRRGATTLAVAMGIYSIAELIWLTTGSVSVANWLMSINSTLYTPATLHGWWPPLLWKGQLRSLATEPSFFGILSIFALPFLWSYLMGSKLKAKYIILVIYFELMIFATNSRTAVFFLLVEIILLVFYNILARNRFLFIRTILILALTGLAFAGNLGLNQVNAHNMSKATSAYQYHEANLGSLKNKKYRSNTARLANVTANIQTVRDYPLMGVGYGLKDAYLYERIPDFGKSQREVMLWGKYMHVEGVLKSGYPSLNKYVDVAVVNGIPGLLLFLLPFGYTALGLLKNRKMLLANRSICLIVIALSGFLGTWMGSVQYPICAGIMTGLLLVFIKQCKHQKGRSMQLK